MKIQKTEVVKILAQGVDDLDPVSIYLEQNGECGKITVTCWDDAGSAFFGAMGEGRSIYDFIAHCNEDYIARKMVNGKLHVTDYEKIAKDLEIDEVYPETLLQHSDELMAVYGQDWMIDLPECEDRRFTYMKLVCKTAIEAVREYNRQQQEDQLG